MSIYLNNARGIELNGTHINVDESQVKTDFIIAQAGNGQILDKRFTDHVQTAYDLNVPLIAIWTIDFTFYLAASLDKWAPPPERELNLMGIKSALYAGTGKRAVSGIILDINNNTYGKDNTVISQNWIKSISEFIYDNCYKMFKLPQWVFVKQSTLDVYKTMPELDAWLTKTDAIASWKSATPGMDTIKADWNSFPIPSDTYKVQYISNAEKVWLSKYANTAYTFDGITDANNKPVTVPLWQYLSSKSGLYNDLNFVGNGSVTPPPVVVPPVTSGSGVSVDLTPVMTAISGLSTQITNLENRINNIFK